MKQIPKLAVILVLIVFFVTAVAVLAACDTHKNDEVYATYKLYKDNAKANNETPLSYQEWLETVRGADGKDGLSAYQIWLENGHSGTQEDFLNWLKGEKGDQGAEGVPGADGVGVVKIEKTATDGLVDTYTITLSNGTTTTFTVTNGATGANGAEGKSAYEIWLENGHSGSENDFLAWLQASVEPHQHKNLQQTTVIEASCAAEGFSIESCPECGCLVSVATLPATGHLDENDDDWCDECGKNMHEATGKPQCQHVCEKCGNCAHSSCTNSVCLKKCTCIDVIILAGQSNADGCTWTNELEKNVSAEKFEYYQSGLTTLIAHNSGDGSWQTDNAPYNFTTVRTGQGASVSQFGPEVGMAEVFENADPARKVCIIKVTFSGTNLYYHWHSPSTGSTGHLYAALVEYTKNRLVDLENAGFTPTIRAFCWMQGESDATVDECTVAYQQYEKYLIDDFKHDLADWVENDKITMVSAYISQCFYWRNYQQINAAKLANATENANWVVIDTIAQGLEFDKEPVGNVDIPHYDSLSMIKLGHLFGQAVVDALTATNE